MYEGDGYEYEPGITLLKSTFPRDVVDQVKTFPMETGDVVIATYAKAGTTWMQEIASQIYLQGDVDATSVSISKRVPHMERRRPSTDPGQKFAQSGLDELLDKTHPRLMKTHLHARIFQKQLSEGKAKFIVVMRNVKDSVVSFYHFHLSNKLHSFSGTWEEFVEAFRARRLLWGDWLEYNLGWWQYKDHPNVLIVKYEDMKKDRQAVIKQVAHFCNQPLSDELLHNIAESTSFASMRYNPATNRHGDLHPHIMDFSVSPFMRKGQVGDWKDYFTDEQNVFVEGHYLKEAAQHGLFFECSA